MKLFNIKLFMLLSAGVLSTTQGCQIVGVSDSFNVGSNSTLSQDDNSKAEEYKFADLLSWTKDLKATDIEKVVKTVTPQGIPAGTFETIIETEDVTQYDYVVNYFASAVLVEDDLVPPGSTRVAIDIRINGIDRQVVYFDGYYVQINAKTYKTNIGLDIEGNKTHVILFKENSYELYKNNEFISDKHTLEGLVFTATETEIIESTSGYELRVADLVISIVDETNFYVTNHLGTKYLCVVYGDFSFATFLNM